MQSGSENRCCCKGAYFINNCDYPKLSLLYLSLPARSRFHVDDDVFWLQHVYWSDGGDLVTIASDNSFYILKYNVSIRFLLLSFSCRVYHIMHAPSRN